MSYSISVENIKCGGCANTITSKVTKVASVEGCEIDVENGTIIVHGDESSRQEVTHLLLKIGYPETGTAEGLKAAKAKARSFVSCAVGKIGA